MTGYKKVFLDTAPLIYFLDADEHFGETVRKIFEDILQSDKQMLTSVITCEEYLVYPYKTGNEEKVAAFREFISECGIPLCPIDVETAKKAAKIRARYKDFKAMDALQLASACMQGCDLFLTNDKQLRQFKDLICVTVDEWAFTMGTRA